MLIFLTTQQKPTTCISQLRCGDSYLQLAKVLRQTFNKLKRSSNSSWPQIETMLGDTVVLSNEAVEQVAREFGWQDVWMTQPATAKAKAKALLTSMSGAMNSYVVPKAASVATSASPPQVPSLPPPAKARRAGPPIFNFPTPKATANTSLADSAAPGTGQVPKAAPPAATDAAADAADADDAAAGPVAVPPDAAAELPDVPGEAESEQEFPVPGEAEVPQSQDDEAAAKCQFCFQRLDAAEPWLVWVKLCVGSFVCCI